MIDIKSELDKFGLSSDNCVVIGSGILNVLGLRESKDIDIIVSREKYKLLSKNDRFTKSRNHNREVLKHGLIEAMLSWTVVGKTFAFEDLEKHSTVIDGVRYNKIEFLLKAKNGWILNGEIRQKDVDDVKLMQEYLKEKK